MAASDALDLAELARTYHEQGWVCVPQLFGAAALATVAPCAAALAALPQDCHWH